MGDTDEELQRALELSAQEHMAKQTTLVLQDELRVSRRDLAPPCSHHWKARGRPQEGFLLQVDTLNQFAPHWAPLIREHQAPSSICGYMAMANAAVLQRLAPKGSGLRSRAELDVLLQSLRDPSVIQTEVRAAMSFVASRRERWMSSRPGEYPSASDKRRYASAWVANYEISDYLRQRPSVQPELSNVFFLRHNQWPERRNATHEERVRLVEEEAFGGSVDSSGRAKFEPGSSVYIVEVFVPERRLQTPEEFRKQHVHKINPADTCAIFLADLNGHFVVALPLLLAQSGNPSEAANAVAVVNTTGTSYLENMTCCFIYDLIYPPEESEPAECITHPAHIHPLVRTASDRHVCDLCESPGTAYRCARGCDFDLCKTCFSLAEPQSPTHESRQDKGAQSLLSEEVVFLTEMGFAEDEARAALAATSGDLEAAVDRLMRT